MKGKRQIERMQGHIDDARLHVHSINTDLLLILQEGPASVTQVERDRISENLTLAEDALREARLLLDGE